MALDGLGSANFFKRLRQAAVAKAEKRSVKYAPFVKLTKVVKKEMPHVCPDVFVSFFKVNARIPGLFPPVLEYPGVPSPGAGRRARTRRCRCHPAGSMPPTICPTRISCMVHTPPSGARGHYADGYERNSPAPRRLRSASAGASNEAGWLCQGSASGRLAIEFYTSRILGAETLRPC